MKCILSVLKCLHELSICQITWSSKTFEKCFLKMFRRCETYLKHTVKVPIYIHCKRKCIRAAHLRDIKIFQAIQLKKQTYICQFKTDTRMTDWIVLHRRFEHDIPSNTPPYMDSPNELLPKIWKSKLFPTEFVGKIQNQYGDVRVQNICQAQAGDLDGSVMRERMWVMGIGYIPGNIRW